MNQEILVVPDPILRQVSSPITSITPELQSQIKDLIYALKHATNPEGVGLSFPQIGIPLQGFVTYLDHTIKVYLNPVIEDQSEAMTLGGIPDHPTLEGCLSIPHLYGPVWRAKKIKISALDEHGVKFSQTLSSFRARVFQHELDHLKGKLFTDYTLRDGLPLYILDQELNEFRRITDPGRVIKW